MTDLLSPEEVRLIQADVWHKYDPLVGRLCRDYLTLWDRIQELEAIIYVDEDGHQFRGPPDGLNKHG